MKSLKDRHQQGVCRERANKVRIRLPVLVLAQSRKLTRRLLRARKRACEPVCVGRGCLFSYQQYPWQSALSPDKYAADQPISESCIGHAACHKSSHIMVLAQSSGMRLERQSLITKTARVALLQRRTRLTVHRTQSLTYKVRVTTISSPPSLPVAWIYGQLGPWLF